LRCTDAQKASSLYLDSELSPERSAAIRGHLRTCSECRLSFEAERELIDAAADLPPLDPPDSIWEEVQARIAQAEVKDSEESPPWRWLRFHWRPALGLSVVAAMAATLWLVRPGPTNTEKADVPVAEQVDSLAIAKSMQASYVQARQEELAEADRDYLETITDLREMLEEDREQWSKQVVAAVDAQLATYRKEAIGTRFAIESGSYMVQTRDTLYANYRSEIGFLQSALAGDLPGGRR
jgi:hypothetical protein